MIDVVHNEALIDETGSSVSLATHNRLGYVLVTLPFKQRELVTLEETTYVSAQNVNTLYIDGTAHSLLTVITKRDFTPQQRSEEMLEVARTIAGVLSIMRDEAVMLNPRPIFLNPDTAREQAAPPSGDV